MVKNDTTVAKAVYNDKLNPEHIANPLISALPPKASLEVFVRRTRLQFDKLTPFNDSAEERILAIHKLKKLYIPIYEHFELYSRMYDSIVASYEYRNPFSPQVISWNYELADPDFDYDIEDDVALDSTTSESNVLTGPSGLGKSTAVNNSLYRLIPQVIVHSKDKVQNPQVTYLCVEMPHDGTRRTLCLNIFKALDVCLESFNAPKYALLYDKPRIQIGKMEAALHVLLREYHIGVLVIDEFQNLLVTGKSKRSEMLQFFDSLANNAKVSLLKVGTPEALGLFKIKHQHLRRAGATLELKPYLQDSDNWKKLVNVLIKRQFVKKPIVLTDKLNDELYKLTCGYPYALVRLWQFVQIEVIQDGSERITPEKIRKVYSRVFSMLKSTFSVIRKGKSATFADMMTVQQYFDNGDKSSAIQHLRHFIDSKALFGPATKHIAEAVTAMESDVDLSPEQKQEIAKVRAKLNQRLIANDAAKDQVLESHIEEAA
jgi:hypothetical protein